MEELKATREEASGRAQNVSATQQAASTGRCRSHECAKRGPTAGLCASPALAGLAESIREKVAHRMRQLPAPEVCST